MKENETMNETMNNEKENETMNKNETMKSEKSAKRSEAAKKAAATRKENKERKEREERERKEQEEREREQEKRLEELGLESSEERSKSLRILSEEKSRAEKAREERERKNREELEKAWDSMPSELSEKVRVFKERVKKENELRDSSSLFASINPSEKFGKGQKIDWYRANRNLPERVLAYMKTNAWKATLLYSFSAPIEEAEKNLAKAREEEQESEVILALSEELESLKSARDTVIKNECSFTFSKSEKACARDIVASSEKKRREGLTTLLASLSGMDLTGNQFIEDLLRKVGSVRPLSAQKMAASGMERANGAIPEIQVLRTVYGELFERMLKAGTIKPAFIPEEVRKFYAPSEDGKKKNRK